MDLMEEESVLKKRNSLYVLAFFMDKIGDM